MSKFALNNPAALGSYFATALAYRRGYVKEAPAVVTDHLRLEDLYAMKGTNVFVGAALDQLRAAQIPAGTEKKGAIEGIDPLTFYVGRVARSFEGDSQPSTLLSTARLIDRDAKRIKSITGELVWDYGLGFAAVNTPKVQGVAGFLGKKGPVRFGDVGIEMNNDYGTVIVVAMDDRPLAQSGKILIQCMTIDQLYGWAASEAGGKGGTIQDVGSAPWGVEKIEATVSLRWSGPKPTKVVACDENGYATDRAVQTRLDAAGLAIQIGEATAYTVIER